MIPSWRTTSRRAGPRRLPSRRPITSSTKSSTMTQQPDLFHRPSPNNAHGAIPSVVDGPASASQSGAVALPTHVLVTSSSFPSLAVSHSVTSFCSNVSITMPAWQTAVDQLSSDPVGSVVRLAELVRLETDAKVLFRDEIRDDYVPSKAADQSAGGRSRTTNHHDSSSSLRSNGNGSYGEDDDGIRDLIREHTSQGESSHGGLKHRVSDVRRDRRQQQRSPKRTVRDQREEVRRQVKEKEHAMVKAALARVAMPPAVRAAAYATAVHEYRAKLHDAQARHTVAQPCFAPQQFSPFDDMNLSRGAIDANQDGAMASSGGPKSVDMVDQAREAVPLNVTAGVPQQLSSAEEWAVDATHSKESVLDDEDHVHSAEGGDESDLSTQFASMPPHVVEELFVLRDAVATLAPAQRSVTTVTALRAAAAVSEERPPHVPAQDGPDATTRTSIDASEAEVLDQASAIGSTIIGSLVEASHSKAGERTDKKRTSKNESRRRGSKKAEAATTSVVLSPTALARNAAVLHPRPILPPTPGMLLGHLAGLGWTVGSFARDDPDEWPTKTSSGGCTWGSSSSNFLTQIDQNDGRSAGRTVSNGTNERHGAASHQEPSSHQESSSMPNDHGVSADALHFVLGVHDACLRSVESSLTASHRSTASNHSRVSISDSHSSLSEQSDGVDFAKNDGMSHVDSSARAHLKSKFGSSKLGSLPEVAASSVLWNDSSLWPWEWPAEYTVLIGNCLLAAGHTDAAWAVVRPLVGRLHELSAAASQHNKMTEGTDLREHKMIGKRPLSAGDNTVPWVKKATLTAPSMSTLFALATSPLAAPTSTGTCQIIGLLAADPATSPKEGLKEGGVSSVSQSEDSKTSATTMSDVDPAAEMVKCIRAIAAADRGMIRPSLVLLSSLINEAYARADYSQVLGYLCAATRDGHDPERLNAAAMRVPCPRWRKRLSVECFRAAVTAVQASCKTAHEKTSSSDRDMKSSNPRSDENTSCDVKSNDGSRHVTEASRAVALRVVVHVAMSLLPHILKDDLDGVKVSPSENRKKVSGNAAWKESTDSIFGDQNSLAGAGGDAAAPKFSASRKWQREASAVTSSVTTRTQSPNPPRQRQNARDGASNRTHAASLPTPPRSAPEPPRNPFASATDVLVVPHVRHFGGAPPAGPQAPTPTSAPVAPAPPASRRNAARLEVQANSNSVVDSIETSVEIKSLSTESLSPTTPSEPSKEATPKALLVQTMTSSPSKYSMDLTSIEDVHRLVSGLLWFLLQSGATGEALRLLGFMYSQNLCRVQSMSFTVLEGLVVAATVHGDAVGRRAALALLKARRRLCGHGPTVAHFVSAETGHVPHTVSHKASSSSSTHRHSASSPAGSDLSVSQGQRRIIVPNSNASGAAEDARRLAHGEVVPIVTTQEEKGKEETPAYSPEFVAWHERRKVALEKAQARQDPQRPALMPNGAILLGMETARAPTGVPAGALRGWQCWGSTRIGW